MDSFTKHSKLVLPGLVLVAIGSTATCHGEGSTATTGTTSTTSTTSTTDPPDAGDAGDAGDAPDVMVPPVKTWTVEKTPVDAELEHIWGSGPHDVYAVGTGGTILHSAGDGVWVQQPNGTIAPVAGISGSGPSDVYVASVFTCPTQGCADGGIEGGFFHSKGDHIWTPILTDCDDGFTVWMIGPDEGYAMGSKGAGDFLVHMKDQNKWVPETLPVATVGPRAMWSSSSMDVYILGQGNRVFHSKGDGAWVAQDNSWNQLFNEIWGSGPDDVYVTATGPLVLHSTGDGNWVPQNIPPIQNTPIGVWGSGRQDVYVVTGGIFSSTGEILHSDGSGVWTRVDGSFPALTAVWGSGPGDVYAAGPHGLILHLK